MRRGRPAPRARADGRAAARPPPRHDQGVVPARVRAVRPRAATPTPASSGRRATPTSPGPRSTTPCAARWSSTCSPRTTCRTTSARSSGCSARDGAVGHLGPALDGRGGPPLDGDLRLPDGHPRRRPRAPRAVAHGRRSRAVWCPTRRRPPTASCTSRCRSWPPASPTATPGRMIGDRRRLRRDDARRRRREPPLPLLPRPRRRGHRARPEHDGQGDRAPGRRLRDAGHRHPRLRRARRAPSPRPGIYDLAIHHDQILVPVVMRHWASST